MLSDDVTIKLPTAQLPSNETRRQLHLIYKITDIHVTPARSSTLWQTFTRFSINDVNNCTCECGYEHCDLMVNEGEYKCTYIYIQNTRTHNTHTHYKKRSIVVDAINSHITLPECYLPIYSLTTVLIKK